MMNGRALRRVLTLALALGLGWSSAVRADALQEAPARARQRVAAGTGLLVTGTVLAVASSLVAPAAIACGLSESGTHRELCTRGFAYGTFGAFAGANLLLVAPGAWLLGAGYAEVPIPRAERAVFERRARSALALTIVGAAFTAGGLLANTLSFGIGYPFGEIAPFLGPTVLAPGEIMMTVGLYRYQKYRWLAGRGSPGVSLQLAPDIAPRSTGLRLMGSF